MSPSGQPMIIARKIVDGKRGHFLAKAVPFGCDFCRQRKFVNSFCGVHIFDYSRMGGICSRRSTDDNTLGEQVSNVGGHGHQDSVGCQAQGFSSKTVADLTPPSVEEIMEKQSQDPISFSERTASDSGNRKSTDIEPEVLRSNNGQSQKSVCNKSKPTAAAKTGTAKASALLCFALCVPEVNSLLGRAGTVGLGKAVEVLDTLGSSMSSLQPSSGFVSGSAKNKIAILAFEVANTIVKGSNLLQSLSKENIKHLKEVVLPSEGVQFLVSRDMDELLRISASDKREELKIFSGEVVRFGNRCKDPQWHNLDRYFDRLGSNLVPQRQSKEEIAAVLQQLMTLVQYTAELYHESQALDRFEQDHRRKQQEEENTNPVQKGDSLALLRAELKSQMKHVKNLRKKSLWSKNLDEVMEKLVDIVHFLHIEIHDAFGSAGGDVTVKVSLNNRQTLGSAGLALHYANIISQIDTLNFFGSNFTVPQIKAEMERILRWLVPIANNTTKSEANRKQEGQNDLLRIETLHHADKEKAEACILELVVWLHHFISQSRSGANGSVKSPVKSPGHSPTENISALLLSAQKPGSPTSVLTPEDQAMLRDVNFRKLTPGISKSQEFDTAKTRLSKKNRLSKSSSHSPATGNKDVDSTSELPSTLPVNDVDIDRIKALDVIDRVDTLGTLTKVLRPPTKIKLSGKKKKSVDASASDLRELAIMPSLETLLDVPFPGNPRNQIMWSMMTSGPNQQSFAKWWVRSQTSTCILAIDYCFVDCLIRVCFAAWKMERAGAIYKLRWRILDQVNVFTCTSFAEVHVDLDRWGGYLNEPSDAPKRDAVVWMIIRYKACPKFGFFVHPVDAVKSFIATIR
ncbi:hypothetical protein ACLOJK_001122 [Asimina triloba]